jgi:alanine dehydrogenase
MSWLETGVLTSARKENEKRVPIHPEHLAWIDPDLRRHLVFERGYGREFGVSDETLAAAGVTVVDRSEVLTRCEAIILMKPVAADLRELREGTVFWGFPHCVQNSDVTQAAIDRRLTLIAWEEMYQGARDGRRAQRVKNFYRQNELAGYTGVLHALQLLGIDGHYGPPRRAVILSFGSVSRGAANALVGCGFNDVTVYTLRPPHRIVDQIFACRYRQIAAGESGEAPTVIVDPDGARRPLSDELARCDVIVNGILQDTERPLMFMTANDVDRLKTGCLIIDISCDHGMGFPGATPTTFAEPTYPLGPATYYAVDHTPSHLWNAASWVISEALLPHLASVMGGPEAWSRNQVVADAIEVRDGVVINPRILSFQDRGAEYPHARRA